MVHGDRRGLFRFRWSVAHPPGGYRVDHPSAPFKKGPLAKTIVQVGFGLVWGGEERAIEEVGKNMCSVLLYAARRPCLHVSKRESSPGPVDGIFFDCLVVGKPPPL